jgi:hypothetical protein
VNVALPDLDGRPMGARRARGRATRSISVITIPSFNKVVEPAYGISSRLSKTRDADRARLKNVEYARFRLFTFRGICTE